MIYVVTGVSNGKIIRPRTFNEESSATIELKRIFDEKMAKHLLDGKYIATKRLGADSATLCTNSDFMEITVFACMAR